jgi:hypothetical protein
MNSAIEAVAALRIRGGIARRRCQTGRLVGEVVRDEAVRIAAPQTQVDTSVDEPDARKAKSRIALGVSVRRRLRI